MMVVDARPLKRNLKNSFVLAFFGLLIMSSYSLQLQEANAYIGYVPVAMTGEYLAAVFFGIVFLGAIVPTRINRPSDFFYFFYVFFVLLPYLLLHNIRAEIGFGGFFLNFSVLVFPVFLVKVLVRYLPSFRFPAFLNQAAIIFFLSLIIGAGVVVALFNPTASAGFDFSTAYVRRLEGRDIFISGSLYSYASTAILNGFAPFIAFWACWKKRTWLMVIPLLCWLAFFYLLGIKAPLLFIAVAALLGYAARSEKIESFVSSVYFLVVVSFFIFFIEYASSGYSYVADYFSRRSFTVPPWVIASYFEYMSSDNSPWDLLTGVSGSKPISFIVGEDFLGYEGLNANTNAFMYGLTSGGLVLYLITIALVAVVFSLLDNSFVKKSNPVFIYIGFSYSILVVEQSATTALLSSGIGVLMAFMIFSKKNLSDRYAK